MKSLKDKSAKAASAAAIQRVRSVLSGIIGNDALQLSEGLGRLVVTTADDLRAKGPGHFQLSAGTLARFSLPDNLQALVDQQRLGVKRAIESIGDVESGAIMRHASGSEEWMMVLRDASQPGKWRTQSIDLSGFAGHATFADRDEAVRAAAQEGFSVRDDAALDRIQDSPAFQRGLFVVDLLARVNAGLLTQQDGDRLLAEYDAKDRVLHSIAAGAAQAFVVAGGQIMYMLADRIRVGDEAAVFLHEITHRYGKRVLGERGFASLIAKLKSWQSRPEQSIERLIFDSANTRATRAARGNRVLFEDELFAYAVEDAVQRGVKPSASAHPESARAWLDQVVGTLQGVLHGITGSPAAPIDAQALVDLAYAFAQLESPERVQRIMSELSAQDALTLKAWVDRKGGSAWYSELERRVSQRGQDKMPAGQWAAWLHAQTKSGIKPDELEWSGLTDWLEGMPEEESVSRQEVLRFIAVNGVQVQDVTMAGTTLLAYADRSPTSENTWIVNDENDNLLTTFEGQAAADAFVSEYNATRTRAARYEEHVLPGGQNYREVLLTLPVKDGNPTAWQVLNENRNVITFYRDPAKAADFVERNIAFYSRLSINPVGSDTPQFKTPHWDASNVLAHVRMNDRVDVDGRRTLFVEEIQSDWAQEGRKRGFIDVRPPSRDDLSVIPSGHANFNWIVYPKSRSVEAASLVGVRLDAVSAERAIDQIVSEGRHSLGSTQMGDVLVWAEKAGVLRAPFVQKTDSWLTLAIKRVVMLAVEGGYDQVAFVNGDQSVQRYNLSKEIDHLSYDGDKLQAWDKNRQNVINKDNINPEDVHIYVGEVVAEKLFDQPVKDGRMTLEGLDLIVGGEGMKTFYDQIVPQAANKLLPKIGGGKISSATLPGMIPGEFSVQARYPGYAISTDRGFVTVSGVLSGDAAPNVDSREAVFPTREAAIEGLKAAAGATKQPAFEITPGIREAVSRGLPLFSRVSAKSVQASKPLGERISLAIKSVYRDERLWEILLNSKAQAGPSDGGCLICARAIMLAAGTGELVRIVNEKSAPNTEHYGVEVDGVIHDFNGAFKTPQAWIDKFSRLESLNGKKLSFARGHDKVALVPEDEAAVQSIARLLEHAQGNAPAIESHLTDSPEFKRWFGESKVLGEDGKPMVLHHGTTRGFSKFRVPAYFTSSRRDAQDFSASEKTPVVIDVHLSIKNPVVIDDFFQFMNWNEGDVKKWEALGYDGAVLKKARPFEPAMYIAFHPEQIKSATDNSGQFALDSASILRSVPRPQFYSQLQRVIEQVPDRIASMAAPQWKLWLDANTSKLGVKKEEIEWSGIRDYLELQGDAKLSKNDLAAYLDESGVRVGEVMLGEPSESDITELLEDEAGEGMDRADAIDFLSRDDNRSKYSQYVFPGGTNYREVLITLPKQQVFSQYKAYQKVLIAKYGSWMDSFDDRTPEESAELKRTAAADAEFAKKNPEPSAYKSSHWDDLNVLAHFRVNDRIDADGNKVLFIEELQSDWGQEGKKGGFIEDVQPTGEITLTRDGNAFVVANNGVAVWAGLSEQRAQAVLAEQQARGLQTTTRTGGVPLAPFVTKTDSWLALALKRIAVMAVDGGYDKVAFISGEQSAERYNLSKQIDRIEYEPAGDGLYEVVAYAQSGVKVINEDEIDIDRVRQLVGKEIAKMILAGDGEPTQPGGWGVFDGDKKVFESRDIANAQEYARVADFPVTVRRLNEGFRDWRVLRGVDLEVGGDGMKAFYDQLVPQAMNKLLSKIGGEKIGSLSLGPKAVVEAEAGGYTVKRGYMRVKAYDSKALADQHAESLNAGQASFDVTDKMREVVREGLPLFSVRAPEQEAPVNAFDGWFKGSAIVDSLGQPLIVYRGEGSGRERNIYSLADTRESAIFLTPEKEVAQAYERNGREPRAFYVKADRVIDLTQDTGQARAFIAEWAAYFDDWIDRGSGEPVDPVECVLGGRLFDYEGDWSGERWKSLQAEVLASYDAAYLPDWDNDKGMFKALIIGSTASLKSATHNTGAYDPENPDIRFSFAGASAQTADMLTLTAAQSRLADGEDAESVRRSTGWHKGVDGKWRFEISDEEAKLKPSAEWSSAIIKAFGEFNEALEDKEGAEQVRNAFLRALGQSPSTVSSETKKRSDYRKLERAYEAADQRVTDARLLLIPQCHEPLRLRDVLDHPRLFAAYPALKDVVFKLDPGQPARSGYYADKILTIALSDKSDDEGLLSDLLHEIQHAIQHVEGFARGGNPSEGLQELERTHALIDGVNEQLSYIAAQKDIAKKANDTAKTAELSGLYETVMNYKLEKLVPRALLDPVDEYRRLAGEVEARNVQVRQGLTSDERVATAPGATEDVPVSDVIVRFNGVDALRVPEPANKRTSFSRWFGKSVVVDSDGKPMPMYHGSDQTFTVFDYSRIGTQGRSEGAGFYFTSDREVATGYGTPMEVYLSIQKPLAYDAKPFGASTLRKVILRVAQIEALADGVEIADGFLSNYGDARTSGLDATLDFAAELIGDSASALDQLGGMVAAGVNPVYVNRAVHEVTGYDGVVSKGFINKGDGSNLIYVAFFQEQIKSTENNGEYDRANPDIRFSVRSPAENFERWSGGAPFFPLGARHHFSSGSAVVVEALHGTTNAGVTVFSRDRANPGSDFGSGFYASNSVQDVAANYANLEGGDLTSRLANEVMDITDAMLEDDDLGLKLISEYLSSIGSDVVPAKESLIDLSGDYLELAASHAARMKLTDGAPNTMKLFMRFKNPAVLGGKGETFFDFNRPYNEDTDEFGEPSGLLVDFMSAMDEALSGFDAPLDDIKRAKERLLEVAQEADGIAFSELVQIFKHRMFNALFETYGEALRQVLAGMGFDGIIDSTVYAKFGPRRSSDGHSMLPGMPGLSAGTVHFIAFEPEQIKSATGNSGEYDASNSDIRMSIPDRPHVTEPDPIALAIKGAYEDERLWKVLVEESTAQSGPFDGACLICAKAIIRAVGHGTLVRQISVQFDDKQTEHYGAKIGDRVYDFSGGYAKPAEWIDAIVRLENITDRKLRYAKGYDSNSLICDDPQAEKRVAAILVEHLEGRAPVVRQTDKAEFKDWMGPDSNLLFEDGSPLVIYHGTNATFTEFRRSKIGAMGPGVYFGDSLEVAKCYDGNGAGQQIVMAAYARGKYLSNMEWTAYIAKHGWAGAEAAAKADGWSGVRDTMYESSVVVWDPADIRLVAEPQGQQLQEKEKSGADSSLDFLESEEEPSPARMKMG